MHSVILVKSGVTLALVLPFELSDSGLLGNIFQLTPGFLKLRLETEGVALAVARRRIVVRLRGVVRQGWVRGRRGSWIPLDKPENTKRIVRNGKKSRESCEGS
jgi:hypothetical protein